MLKGSVFTRRWKYWNTSSLGMSKSGTSVLTPNVAAKVSPIRLGTTAT